MKQSSLLLITATTVLRAGTVEPLLTPPPSQSDWFKPLIDIRARYEFAEIEGRDQSNAFTVRERLGLQTMEWYGFSALIEGEFSQAIVDDYHGGAAGASPFDLANSVIADPETSELNQAYLQYSGYDMVSKVGRQRIIYDNAALVGNVGWRQNEQTFDAISVSGKWIDPLTINYSYLNQVNRIFGSEAFTNFDYVKSDTHLLNLSYTGIEGMKLGAYSYLMEFDDKPNWDNNTFGVSAAKSIGGFDFYAELALQDGAGFASNDEALYIHATTTKTFGPQSLTLGFESLGAGFKTPLATIHAFNGFADAFLLGRSEGNHHGLADIYVSHTMPTFWGMKWTNVIHAFGDNEISTSYGWEYNSVLVKKFDENFTALAKYALFESEGDAFVGAAALPDITRFSVELSFKF